MDFYYNANKLQLHCYSVYLNAHHVWCRQGNTVQNAVFTKIFIDLILSNIISVKGFLFIETFSNYDFNDIYIQEDCTT